MFYLYIYYKVIKLLIVLLLFTRNTIIKKKYAKPFIFQENY